ncbi:unnamed protein product [Soboliphyme baturini]|uniref:Palmitoyltransferase n=1 Tax=Soboliphyme baturini TaxID=241478 RepID=A0A183IAE1_9BILA|nr:unnamed protein product [Soboliphyme baturini]
MSASVSHFDELSNFIAITITLSNHVLHYKGYEALNSSCSRGSWYEHICEQLHSLFTSIIQCDFFLVRYPVLVLNILIFCLVIVSSILILVGLCTVNTLLIPWHSPMSSEDSFPSDVRKIALGIFFLGLQLFHISLILIVTAKFQQMTERKRKPMYKVDGTVSLIRFSIYEMNGTRCVFVGHCCS